MATSGTTTWSLDIASIIETASRRARGKDAGQMSAKDSKDARNCLNMVLTDLTNAGYALSKLEYKTFPLTQGTESYVLEEDVLDIFDVVYAKYNGAGQDPEFTETALTRIDLAAYNQLNFKSMQSYLSQFALHRGMEDVTMYIYPTCTNDDDEIRYWALTRTDDVTASYQDVDLSYRYTNTLIAGVAYYIALERPEGEVSEEKIARLKSSYENSMETAFGEDRDRSSMFLTPGFRNYR